MTSTEKLQEQANMLAKHTWIGTPLELEERKKRYVEQGGSFMDILSNI